MAEDATSTGQAVTIVTHQGLPQGSSDDLLLGKAMQSLGLRVHFVAWNDPAACWSRPQIAIVRSAWDYHRVPREWFDWIDRADIATRLINPGSILRWNTDKLYISELRQAGMQCVPTAFVNQGDSLALHSILDQQNWSDIVIKPAIGASAHGVRRFSARDHAVQAQDYLAAVTTDCAALVQPYLREVETARERSLVFIEGIFSHAFTKSAFNTDAGGTADLQPHKPNSEELTVAADALANTPSFCTYARVDLIPSADGPLLAELELIEPDLGLRCHPAAAARLADACARQARMSE